MINKLATYFLVLTIVAGCSQSPIEKDKPEKPPIVEQPQKPEEIKVKKIDENKDWVYIEKTEITELYTEDKQKPFRDMLEVMVITSGDEFENWYNTNYTPYPEMTLFKINIDNEEISKTNQFISETYYDKLEAVGHHMFSYKSFINDEILSVIIHNGSFIPGSDFKREIIIYNISIKDGHILSNSELLTLNNLTIEDVKEQSLDYYLEQNGTIPCDEVQTSDNQFCYQNPSRVTESDSYLFMKDNHLIHMGFINIRNNGEYVKIQIDES